MKNKIFYSLQNKIIFFAVFFVIPPLLILNIVTSDQYNKQYKNAMNAITTRLAGQITNNIDTYFQKINQISFMPYYDGEIQEILNNSFLSNGENLNNDLDIKYKLNDFLFQMSLQDKYIRSIYIFDMDNDLIAQRNTSGRNSDTDFFIPYIENMGELESQTIATHDQTYVRQSDSVVFSFIRLIKEVKTNTPIGYLVLDISIDSMEDILHGIDSPFYNNVEIFNNNNETIYTMTNDERANEYTKDVVKNIEEYSIFEVNEIKYYLSYSVSEYTGFTVVISVEENELMGDMNNLRNRNLFLLLFLLFSVLFVTILGTTRLIIPLKRLVEAMKSVSKGDFKTQVTIKTKDEIGILSQNFNQMINYIDTLITKEYQAELKNKDSELRALQGQINPHFLYNTLESISMEAEINDDTDVADMINDLGVFFRYSIENKSKFINIMDEIDHISIYIAIQNIRFDKRIVFTYNVLDELKNWNIAKLMIQPLIENSIIHGLRNNNDILFINLNIEKKDNLIILTIRDNGNGMSHNKRESLLKFIYNENIEDTSKSIGLKNVQQRIKLIYGSEYGISIASKKGCWTELVIQFPHTQTEVDSYLNNGVKND
ncbi:MAG: cache domain-containing sensor histidine kinase [Pleomorphochaeta sp.]